MNTLLSIVLIIVFFFVFLRSVRTDHLAPNLDPATSYEEAEKRLQVWAEEEAELPLQEVCHTKFLSHGRQTEQVILLFHGYTTCPEQFVKLGRMFFESRRWMPRVETFLDSSLMKSKRGIFFG